MIREFICDIKEFARQFIWPRCQEVNNWEKNKGIDRNMKRGGETNQSRISHDFIIDRVRLVLDRYFIEMMYFTSIL